MAVASSTSFAGTSDRIPRRRLARGRPPFRAARTTRRRRHRRLGAGVSSTAPAHNPLITLTGVCFPLRLWRGSAAPPSRRRRHRRDRQPRRRRRGDASRLRGKRSPNSVVARSFETVAKGGAPHRWRGPRWVARYRAGERVSSVAPVSGSFAEDEYGHDAGGRPSSWQGARPGMLWQQLGCVVAATPSDALAQGGAASSAPKLGSWRCPRTGRSRASPSRWADVAVNGTGDRKDAPANDVDDTVDGRPC